MDQQTFQLLVLGLHGMWGLVLLLGGMFLRHVSSTLSSIDQSLRNLNDKVLADYATKTELEAIRAYIRERVHELDDNYHDHELWVHLIARHMKFDLPPKTRRGGS